MATAERIVDPDVLARVARLELIARQAVEGFLAGKHPSPYHGSSVEYADHRPYTLGDPLRAIDWKLLAKTDKYYVKLFEEQTNLRATLLLDTSRSMAFADGPLSKFDYACRIAAALAYLLVRQNDAVGLALVDDAVREYLPPRCTPSHFRLILERLEQTTPRSASGLGPVLHELAGRLKRRGMIVLVSDLLDDPEQIASGLGHFRFRKHEVLVFHIMTPAELTFPYERLTRFKDLEGTGQLISNPRLVRRRYLQRLAEHLEQVKRACLESGVSYLRLQTDSPYDRMLSGFLENRARIKRTAKV